MAVDVEIELAGPGGLFDAPPSDPMAPCFALTSGIDRISAAVGAMSARERHGVRLVARMPAPRVDEAARVAEGLRRYADAKVTDLRLRQAALRREGLQTLWLALGFIGICILLSSVLDLLPGEGWLQTLVRDGLVIGGWVALWRPLDLLLFETWLLRRERRIAETVATMPVTVGPTLTG